MSYICHVMVASNTNVSRIVFGSPKINVRRIDACGIIALMAGHFIRRYILPDNYHSSEAMRSPIIAFERKMTIPFAVAGCCPIPAIRWLTYVYF